MSSLDEGVKEFLHLGQTTVLFKDFSVVHSGLCVARLVSIQMSTYRRTTGSES